MRFSFRLEPVLKIRMENEEDAILAQAKAQRDYHNQLGILQNIKGCVDQVMKNEYKHISVSCLMAGSLYIDHLKDSESREEKLLEDKQRALKKKREEMIEARKDRMILQKLKENLHEKHLDKLSKQEEKILDDQCTVLANRKRMS
jgi:flagellar FliJ protein